MRSFYMACPVFQGPGGIASYARRVVETNAPEAWDVLGVGQSATLFPCPPNATVLAAPARQAAFAAKLAADYLRRPPTVFVFAHLGLTRPLGVLPHQPRHQVAVIMHGIEAWVPVPRRRAMGFSRVDSFVFTTEYSRAMFLNFNRPALSPRATTEVIPLSAEGALESSVPTPAPTAARRRVVCVTRLTSDEPLKGISTLLRAAKHLDPATWEVVLVGDGDGKAGYEREAASLGVTDRVRFTGWVEDTQRTTEIAQADVFCLPSAQEGFGIAFLEAMVAGRPCVGAAAGAVPEVLSREAGELFPYGDPAMLAEAITRASDRLRSGELTPASIRGVYEQRFAWQKFQDRWRTYLTGLRGYNG